MPQKADYMIGFFVPFKWSQVLSLAFSAWGGPLNAFEVGSGLAFCLFGLNYTAYAFQLGSGLVFCLFGLNYTAYT